MQEEDQNPRAQIGGNNPPISETLAETHKDLIAKIEPIATRANELGKQIKDGIKDDDQLEVVSTLVIDVKSLGDSLEEKRKIEKEPHLNAGREVDGFFKAFSERLSRISVAFIGAASAYQREKLAAEKRAQEQEAERLRVEAEKKRKQADTAKRPETADRKHDQADELEAQADAAEAAAASQNTDLAKVKTATGATVGAKTEMTFRIVDYEKIPLDKLRPYFKRDQIEAAIKAFTKIHKGASQLEGVHFEEDVKATFRR